MRTKQGRDLDQLFSGTGTARSLTAQPDDSPHLVAGSVWIRNTHSSCTEICLLIDPVRCGMAGPALLFWVAVATAALAFGGVYTNPDQDDEGDLYTTIGDLMRKQLHMTTIILEDIKTLTVDARELSKKVNVLENKMAEGSNEVQEIKDTLGEQTKGLEDKIAKQNEKVKYLYTLGMNKSVDMSTDIVDSVLMGVLCPDCSDCAEAAAFPNYGSGVYHERGGVKMYCDIEGDEGWTVIQRRHNSGPQSFDKNWTDYKNGFGDLNGEFWFGNEQIHALTSRKPHTIQFVFEDCGDHGSDRLVADYRTFSVGNESSGYRLTIEGYSGNATDGMNGCPSSSDKHSGMRFSTRDKDNDQCSSSRNCAAQYGGGWWYNCCYCSCLNKRERSTDPPIDWSAYDRINCKASKMRIKPLLN